MKKVTVILLAVLVILLLIACLNIGKIKTLFSDQPVKKFTVIVVHADGTEKEFNYKSKEEYLAPALLSRGLIKTADGEGGMEVLVADKEKAEDGAAWVAYEGQYYVEQPLDCTRIMDGTVYKLVYTPAQG